MGSQPAGARSISLLLALSFAFTYFFFLEYLPPVRHVHIPYDLPGYHYSLNDYVFQALRAGRLPEWDPSLDCGLTLAGNVQTASFYPPIWLLYLANFNRSTLAYQTLEIFVFIHVWIAFALCYAWFRRRRLASMAAILGAAVFAFSGYMLLQLQHLGLVCAYAWLPLGFWGIDEYLSAGAWRKLWKLVVASTLAFLAGYPPTWVVFAVCMLAYAGVRYPFRWRPPVMAACGLAVSLLFSMVQLLPAWEAARLVENVPHYGAGIKAIRFYISYFVPNYFDFGLHTPVLTNFGYEYLYLGAPALFGLGCLFRRAGRRAAVPLLGVLAVSLVAVTNPWGIVWAVIGHFPMLGNLVRAWYFLAGVTAAVAPLAAIGIDGFLKQQRPPGRNWAAALGTLACAGWSWRLLHMPLPVGWRSLLPSLVTLAIFAAAMWLYRSASGAWKLALATALLLTAGIDYRVWGASLRVNAAPGDLDRQSYRSGILPGMDGRDYDELRRNSRYRIVSDVNNPFPLEFRHFGLTTPQGVEPLIPRQYESILGNPPGNSYSDIDPIRQKDLLRLLGVRYILSAENGLRIQQLERDPDFRRLPGKAYWKVFELRNAPPPYRWEQDDPATGVQAVEWQPEKRAFRVHASRPGRLVLVEQYYPGWEASVDGQRVAISRWHAAFQAVAVPEGDHTVVFQFRSRTLRWGALISACSLLAILLLYRLGPAFARPSGRF